MTTLTVLGILLVYTLCALILELWFEVDMIFESCPEQVELWKAFFVFVPGANIFALFALSADALFHVPPTDWNRD